MDDTLPVGCTGRGGRLCRCAGWRRRRGRGAILEIIEDVVSGDATGETITVTLAEPGVVTRVGLVNGYAKQVAGVDWYPNNRRIVAVTWGFDDGSSVEQTFAEQAAMQRLKVPPVETATVTLTITAVTPPGPGSLGRDYTAISEVSVTGRRAG